MKTSHKPENLTMFQFKYFYKVQPLIIIMWKKKTTRLLEEVKFKQSIIMQVFCDTCIIVWEGLVSGVKLWSKHLIYVFHKAVVSKFSSF